MFKARIYKVVIIPICSIFEGDHLLREERMKPIVKFVKPGTELCIEAEKWEKDVDERFISKLNLKASESGRPSRTRRFSKKSSSSK